MNRPPLAVLKLPVLLLLLALAFALAGIWWSRGLAREAGTALQQQRSALNGATQTLDRSRQQQQLIATHLAAYRALETRGFVGPEDRLAWIEAAQLASRDVGLYGLDYRLTPRTASPPDLAQSLPLGQTTMILNLPILVETDLARYLAALKARTGGMARVHTCRLSRFDNAPFQAVNLPRLQVECELTWFTVSQESGGTP
ncbi:MAG: hypothetical protein R6W97_05635 [Thiobacillus sp.]